MPYCLYLRKSRADAEAEARGEGETLARHEKILLDLAKRLKISIAKAYSELVSGETISSRPVMQQLLHDVEQELWEGVLVVEVERLARGDTIDQGIVAQTFKYANTKIITPVKIYDPNNDFDEEYFEFGLFMSRREYKTINRRLQQGRIQSVKEGKYAGNKPPYGYKRKKLEETKGYTLEPNPEQAPVVKMIYNWYTDGIGVSRIVRKLNDMKIAAAMGGDWVNASVQDILRNPVYIGKVRWNWRPQVKKMVDGEVIKMRPRAKEGDWMVADGLHEPIINKDVFGKAQELLSRNQSPRIPARKNIKNPLAGLIVCGKCGRKMVRRPYSSGQKDSLICPVTSCDNVSSYLYLVEDKLLQVLDEWLKNYKVQYKQDSKEPGSAPDPSPEIIRKAVLKVEKEIEVYYKQLDKLHDLLEQGIYDTDTFLERNRILSEKIKTAQTDKSSLNEQLKQLSLQKVSKQEIIPNMERVIEKYHKIKDPDTKNRLLKEVLDKVIYLKTNKGTRGNRNAMDDFELILYPNLPKRME